MKSPLSLYFRHFVNSSKLSQSKGGKAATVKDKEEAPAAPAPEQPPQPRDATHAEKEEIVYLNLSELFPFKDHPFGVRDDAEMKGLVESVKDNGLHQPALVRPREGGGYEIIAGHRRQRASELAGFANMPCIVRNMTDDEAILSCLFQIVDFRPLFLRLLRMFLSFMPLSLTTEKKLFCQTHAKEKRCNLQKKIATLSKPFIACNCIVSPLFSDTHICKLFIIFAAACPPDTPADCTRHTS
ncbi:hypothetical protein ADH66_07910 [Acutalibacter muris]|uniref:ParB-like N-terminal domain-containing protein n=1 Tax=Acutalibacter muris TaxID=1796620 RepID=A0ABM6L5L5_9FIRM|nr:hypothetical protein ADH66_07910 [Acutalibacter muris]